MAANAGARQTQDQAPLPRREAVDHVYAELVLGIVVIGIVFVFSATFPLADRTLDGDSPYSFLYKQLAFAGVGTALLLLAIALRPDQIGRLALWVAAFLVPVMLACRFSPWGREVNGTWGWIEVFGQRLQPSEFAKVAYVVLLATVLGRPEVRGWTGGHAWRVSLASMVTMLILLAIQEDMGMSLLIIAITLTMLFLRGFKVGWIAVWAIGLFGLGLGAALTSPERLSRLTMFLHPETDPANHGFHYCQMLAALARGGLGGAGLGMSPDKWGALPEAHTDSIFCIIGGEVGIIGAILLLAIIVSMGVRALRIAERSVDPVAWHMAAGLGFALLLQSLINVAVATVSLPCTGLTLPFISAGGSSLISSLAAAGVILSVSRYQRQDAGG